MLRETRYTRQDFEEEVKSFARDVRKKTRKPVEKIGWALMINKELTWLVVSVLNHEGHELKRNVAI